MILGRKFEPEDWEKIDDAVEPFSPLDCDKDFFEIINRSLAITGVEDGTVMACGGITYISDNEGVIWLKVSKKCLNRSYFWARSILDTFRIMTDSIGEMKLHTYVLAKFCRGERMAKMIGLKRTDIIETLNGNIYYKYTTVC